MLWDLVPRKTVRSRPEEPDSQVTEAEWLLLQHAHLDMSDISFPRDGMEILIASKASINEAHCVRVMPRKEGDTGISGQRPTKQTVTCVVNGPNTRLEKACSASPKTISNVMLLMGHDRVASKTTVFQNDQSRV